MSAEVRNSCLIILFYACITFPINLNAQEITQEKKKESWFKRNVSLNGGFGANLLYYNAWGIPPRVRPGTWMFNGNISLKIGQFNLPIGFLFTEQERRFLQPFNQYGISPTYKWATIHLGYRSMAFSPYTLSGILFYGAGMEINPGKLRFSAMYGRLNRAVAEDTLKPNQGIPAFKRMGMGFKIGYGTPRNNLNLIYFQATDDILSLPYVPILSQLKPQDNKVFGMNFKFSIGKFFLDGDGAMSVFTRDKRDSLLIYQSEIKAFNNFQRFIQHRTSTQLSNAFQTAIGVAFKKFQLRLQYKRISPNYRSLGTFYFLTDIENITITPTFVFGKNKFRISISGGLQRDNTSGTKLATTVRQIGAINFSWAPKPEIGTDIQLNNFGTTQNPGTAPIQDSLKQYQLTRSILITQRFGKSTKTKSRNISMTGSYQTFVDYNAFSRSFLQNKMVNFNASYNLSIISKGIGFGGGIITTQTQNEQFTNFQVGPQLNFTKSFLKGKINFNSGATILSSNSNLGSSGTNISIFTSAGYMISKRQRFQLNLNFIRSNGFTPNAPTFAELRFNAGYNFNF